MRKCLQAIRFILPKDAAMKVCQHVLESLLIKKKYDFPLTDMVHSVPVIFQVLVKWYNIYNAPGGPSAHAEWNQFVTCFMTLMGYNTERLTWTRNVSQ